MFQGTCLRCNQPFTARSPAKKFCKPSHRVAYCVKLQNKLRREGVIPKPKPLVLITSKEQMEQVLKEQPTVSRERVQQSITAQNSRRKIIEHDEDGLPVFAQED